MNSGGAISPRATMAGGAWVHALPQDDLGNRGLVCFLLFFPSLLAVRIPFTCKSKNATNGS